MKNAANLVTEAGFIVFNSLRINVVSILAIVLYFVELTH